MDFDKLIKSRASVRKFNNKKPDWRDIIEAIEAARFIPTAGGNYVQKFIIVDDPDLIDKIAVACQQDFVGKAKYVVVVCSNQERLKNAYGEKGENYSRQQAGAAIQNFLVKLEEFGLSTCWVGYFVDYQLKKILEIPEKANIEAVFPIGYEFEKKRTKKVPIDLDNILYFNLYGETHMNRAFDKSQDA
jgi:nitroreductase